MEIKRKKHDFCSHKNCVVIGATQMCISILKLLHQYNWKILCVVSSDQVVQDYCDTNNIKSCRSLKDVVESGFVLFSVINFQIISDSYLKAHNIPLAINYHDSILPSYGGVNSTSWAIYNKELVHGVTWHLISSDIDGGDILKQTSFPINSKETALSLNLKCSSEGVKLFDSLLNDFESNSLMPVKQNSKGRTYFGLEKIPENCGVIDFDNSFEEIDRLSRALDFGGGNFPNPIGSLKIWDGRSVFLANSLGYIPDPKAKPGKVYSSINDPLMIGIFGGKLIIGDVKSIDGLNISIKDTNFRLDETIPNFHINLEEKEILEHVKKSERRIVNRCFSDKPLSPLIDQKNCSRGSPSLCRRILSSGKDNYDLMVASVFLSLSSFIREGSSAIVWSKASTNSRFLDEVLVKLCLIDLNHLQKNKSFSDVVSLIQQYIEESDLVSRDLLYRYSRFRVRGDFEVVFSDNPLSEEYFWLSDYRIRIVITPDNLYIDGYSVDETIINEMCFSIQSCMKSSGMNGEIHLDDILSQAKAFKESSSPKESSPSEQKIPNLEITPSFLEMFERKALEFPKAAALLVEETQIDYGTLNQRANQFAHYLKRKGVQPDSLIGVCIDRSIELIITLLGIIKAGCTYLPFDPTHPSQRTLFILQDAKVDCLITHSPSASLFNEYRGDCIYIDNDWDRILKENTNNLLRNTDENHLIYVIYTSGSTGKPKGVEVYESAVDNLIHSVNRRIHCSNIDRWLALTTISFDISNLEIFLPLSQGASIVLATDKAAKDPQKIIELLRHKDITFVQSTPSLWQMIIESKWKGRKGLTVFCGGEALPKELSKKLLQLGVNLWNMYGPTETTIWSSMQKVDASDELISIGSPIDNTEFLIMDEHHKIVPAGVPGELCIGGKGLARGYRNRKELTNSKFIDSPYGRLYKTGDLVRELNDGSIEFIGRLDQQVKIRGFRIELGEIEEVLKSVKGVQQVVVKAYEMKPGDIRLIAYFQGEVSTEELKLAVSNFLPSYMQPNIYHELEQFPLTPNQKIDRNALLPPKDIGLERDEYVKPTNVAERTISEIFGNFLEVERVSIEANFFSLGGHSLLAAQVVSEINKAFCIDLPFSVIFEHPSPRTLATAVGLALNVGGNLKPILRLPRQKSYELSHSQSKIWIDEQITPSTPLYSVPQVLEILGRLDVERFRKSVEQTLQSHEIFQVVFIQTNSGAKQVIRKKHPLSFRYVDLSKRNNPSRSAKYLISSEAKKGFNLMRGPLYQFILIRISENEFSFFFNFHHIIFDGFSTNLFLSELISIYENGVDEENSIMIDKKPQYLDYVTWQKENIYETNAEVVSSSLRDMFKDISSSPLFSSNVEKAKRLTRAGKSLNFSIKQNLLKRIYAFIKENNTTIFVFMLAAYHLLLVRYASCKKFVVGVPFSGRDNGYLNSMIGCFINVVPFPTSSADYDTFVDLLKRFSKYHTELLKNQNAPFEQLMNESRMENIADGSSVFQVMLNLLPKVTHKKMGNLELGLRQVDRGMSHFDLSLILQETLGEISGIFEYNSAVFSRKEIRLFTQHFKSLIEDVIRDPNRLISQYKFISQREMTERLVDWNTSGIPYDKKRTIIDSIESQAKENPDKIAIVCGDQELTYKALNIEANRIANSLQKSGVKAEDKIGICTHRNSKFLIAVLGILKSGAAYVPIDPKEPHDRIESIIHDLNPFCIITGESLDLVFADFQVEIFNIDQFDCEDVNNPKTRILRDQLAYVIYTSGSTGKPKGVEIEHDSITDRVMWKQAAYPLSNSDVMLHTYSFIFDGAIINYFWPLCFGAKLVISTDSEQYDPDSLTRLIQDCRVSVVDMLPTLIHGIIEASDFKKCTSLKYVFSGGEALSGQIVRVFYRRCSWAKLYNTYGPTEATVEASVWECEPSFSGNVAPIGRPIAGAKLYVLDEHKNLVPKGVQGELYIGGIGVARSYLNEPELTRTKFIKNPFDHGRLYRTGDLVKLNHDGNLEFLGRADNQVKVRGYRIELGEVESLLMRMNEVERVAITIKGKGLNKKIIAYVQLSDKILNSTLKSSMMGFLEKSLPRYMIPSQVEILDKIPTLLNGKIDYKNLPEILQKKEMVSHQLIEKPTCNIEMKLLNIWKELLDTQDLSVNDNFFEVGGNSLLGIRLISKIKQVLKCSIPLKFLFLYPTIRSLAFCVKNPTEEINTFIPIQMKGHGDKTPFFCIHPVGGSILCYSNLAKHWSDERPFYAIQARGLEKKERRLKSISVMASEYIKSIKMIQPRGPYLIGGWSFGGHVAAEIVRKLVEMGDDVKGLVLIDTSAKIDKFRNFDFRNESLLYSELIEHYNLPSKSENSELSPREKLFRLLEWGSDKDNISHPQKDRLERILRVVKSNYYALKNFYHSPNINVPTLLLKAQENSENSPDLGWNEYIKELHVREMSGDHWGVVYENSAKNYALVIQESIESIFEGMVLVGSRS